MTDHWTPNTADIRKACERSWLLTGADFDRWLASTIRDAQAGALRKFADGTGVDVSDRDDEYMSGYRQAQRYTLVRLGTAIARIDDVEAADV